MCIGYMRGWPPLRPLLNFRGGGTRHHISKQKQKLNVMKQMEFSAQAPKTERTHSLVGKVLFAEGYTAKTAKGEVQGLRLHLDSCPYPLNLLKGSIKGAPCKEGALIGASVSLKGTIRVYNEKEYFNPLECNVESLSGAGKLAIAGVAYAGSLD